MRSARRRITSSSSRVRLPQQAPTRQVRPMLLPAQTPRVPLFRRVRRVQPMLLPALPARTPRVPQVLRRASQLHRRHLGNP